MTPQPQALPPITGHPPPVPEGGFPILAVAILGITATAFLLVSYYIFVTKCCFRWHLVDPLRHFSLTRARLHEDSSTSYSPTWQSRGLNELLIREIPTFRFKKGERNSNLSSSSSSSSKCVVCLNEFQESDMLRLLPKCSHAFHLDCIDVWLLSNSNCPLCRAAISGRNQYKVERIVAPNSSPQDPTIYGGDEEIVDENGGDSGRFLAQSRSNHSSSRKFFEHKIIGKLKGRKAHHVSIMGDEGINLREKDDQFFVQPIRRSFSMDSAVDRDVYLSVQEILRQNREESDESGSRSRRLSIFSFGHGRGSRNSVLPY